MQLCFLIPILVGLICGYLGYLIRMLSFKSLEDDFASLKDDLESSKRRISQLQSDISKFRNQNKEAEKSDDKIGDFKIHFLEEPEEFNAALAKAVFGKKIKENDLKIIDGIGPKIEVLFKTSGIITWKLLSETSVNRLKEVLSKAGERYQIHDPATWPRQSKLAYEGKWEELKNWQKQLDGGREN
jgi:predicted flap endonuclease-1-like 5' DNA nuclease